MQVIPEQMSSFFPSFCGLILFSFLQYWYSNLLKHNGSAKDQTLSLCNLDCSSLQKPIPLFSCFYLVKSMGYYIFLVQRRDHLVFVHFHLILLNITCCNSVHIIMKLSLFSNIINISNKFLVGTAVSFLLTQVLYCAELLFYCVRKVYS